MIVALILLNIFGTTTREPVCTLFLTENNNTYIGDCSYDIPLGSTYIDRDLEKEYMGAYDNL